MKNLLLLAGVIGILVGGYFVYQYMGTDTGHTKSDLILGGVFLVIALACFAIYFFKRFKEDADQEISITKF
jgi:hypothetical protein